MTSKNSATAAALARQTIFPASEPDDLSSHFHRQFIGYLGMALPALLWLLAGWRHTQGLQERWNPLDSVSSYYYTGAVAAFVGILVTLGVFLFSYQGYKNERRWLDRITAIIGGAAAVLVALFPTRAPVEPLIPQWWTPRTGTIHYISAVILFGSFIFFSLVLFPQSRIKTSKNRPRDKQFRNGVYIFCGLVMIACMIWAGIASYRNEDIFWPEVLALEFFAISWLVKGRVIKTAVVAGRRTLHYGLHPKELVSDVRSVIHG